jgi:hypothetical protein
MDALIPMICEEYNYMELAKNTLRGQVTIPMYDKYPKWVIRQLG